MIAQQPPDNAIGVFAFCGSSGRRPLRRKTSVVLLTRERRGGGALLIHRSAVPLLPQEKAKDAGAVTVGDRERVWRVVGGADPYDGSERKRREKVFAEAKRGEKVKYSTLSNVK